MVLGGPRPRPPARRRVQPKVQRNRAARLQHRGRAAHPPGLARTFQPRPHQRAAVARMLAEPAVGLFHQVGAGKTAEMVIGAMELRRLGLVSKPAVVVPNHMLEQFSRECATALPPSPSPGRLERGSRRRAAPRVRRPHRGQWSSGRGDPDPLRVRAPPRLRRDEDRLHTPRAGAATGNARALQRRQAG